MPCKKCKEGKYKWGKTGECEYATKEACESANHKYKEMKQYPTPIGKKTYEEYAKELKEYNLSSAYKVELKDVKTLDKLAAQLESITEKLDKDLGKIEDLSFKARKEEENKNEAIDFTAKTKKETDKIKEQADKRLEEAVKDGKKIHTNWQKSEFVLEKANNNYKAIYDKGEGLAAKTESAIKEFEQQLKALGVKDKPQALQNAKWSVEEFDKQEPNPAKSFKR
jgi:hypothetical protein